MPGSSRGETPAWSSRCHEEDPRIARDPAAARAPRRLLAGPHDRLMV
jgi:hypothetical protein